MRLKNNISVKNVTAHVIVLYTCLGAIIIGLLAFIYFNSRVTTSFATDHPTQDKPKTSGKDFRILQNGKPLDPIMGVAINSEGIFDLQVRMGVDLKKIKSRPLAAEVSVLRGGTKVSSLVFEDVKDLKSKNLQSWINSNYRAGDKLSIQLLNTILEPGQSTKVYSLASVY